MKTEELIALGLTKEQADQVFELRGKEITAAQGKYDALKMQHDALDAQAKEAAKKLEGYDPNWKATLETTQKEAAAKLEAFQFDVAIKMALAGAKAKDPDLVMVKLDKAGLKLNNGEVVGLKEQLEKVQKDLPYLFDAEDAKPQPQFVRPTPGADSGINPDKNAAANAALRAAFGRRTE